MNDYLIVGEEKFIMKINKEIKFFKILDIKFINDINNIYKIIDTGNISYFDFMKKIGEKFIKNLIPKIGYFGSNMILFFLIENGSIIPTVSQYLNLLAPAFLASLINSTKNSLSALEASSPFTDTYKPFFFANSTDLIIFSNNHSLDVLSLCLI